MGFGAVGIAEVVAEGEIEIAAAAAAVEIAALEEPGLVVVVSVVGMAPVIVAEVVVAVVEVVAAAPASVALDKILGIILA